MWGSEVRGQGPGPSRHSLLPQPPAHLVHTVQELQEDGCEAAALPSQGVGPAVAEAMAEGQPLLLHQQTEALQRAVEGIREQLHQRHHLPAHQHSGGCPGDLGAPPRGPLRTWVVMSQPSSRLTSTEEPESRSSTTSTDTCSSLWICGTSRPSDPHVDRRASQGGGHSLPWQADHCFLLPSQTPQG